MMRSATLASTMIAPTTMAAAPRSASAVLLALLALLFLAIPKFASARHADLVSLSVRDLDTGEVLQHHPHQGRVHIAGRYNHRYAVVLHNRSPERVLVVLSVDGVNAVTGETASPEQSGYVLAPWQSTEVRGWRKSLSDVAEFRFAALPDSYAARTDRPDNVGVIGIAVFRERAVPDWREDLRLFDRRGQGPKSEASGARSAPQPAAPAGEPLARDAERAAGKAQSLGTAHGDRRYDPARRVAFERASRRPEQVVSLFYDSRENLIAAGIIRPHRRDRYGLPDPFPIGFVPDPR